MRFFFSLFFYFIVFVFGLNGQTLPAGIPVFEEFARRQQILGNGYKDFSFGLRPIPLKEDLNLRLTKILNNNIEVVDSITLEKKSIKILPLFSTTILNTNRPFGWGNYGLKNGNGIQTLLSPGIFFKLNFLEIQFRPEFMLSQNKAFNGYSDSLSGTSALSRFRYWNFGDNPEWFPSEFNRLAHLGQSYISFSIGKAHLGFSTQNIWWGPGQFSGLIFSNNARGIPHVFLGTKSPANIGIGFLEASLLFGKAKDSGIAPTQNQRLNSLYFQPFSGDWRYINGLSLTYSPKFLKNFSVGFNRVFQRYSKDTPRTLSGILPVFEVFQKEKLFQNGNSVIYDQQAQDQIVSVFFRFKSAKGKFEIYSEFGKHDHNFNWREFILNPEHTRAYILGFQKLFQLPNPGKFIQVRAEIVQQQESVNRYIRYPLLGVTNTSWLTHYQVRGFSNYGESMGPGVGIGANTQILEASIVHGYSKLGVILKRIENHQDFYYQIKQEVPNQFPWLDFSTGVLADFKWNKFNISSSTEFVKATNYQWYGSKKATLDFQGGNRLFTVSANLNLVYSF